MSVGAEKELDDSGIKSGVNYDAWRIPRLMPRKFHALDLDKQLAYLAACAHLAPSPHNTQSWAFGLFPETGSIDVYLDRGQYCQKDGRVIDKRLVLPVSDVVGRQACIGVGCAVGNLVIAGEYFGLDPVVSLIEINEEEVKPLSDPADKTARRYVPMAKVLFDRFSSGNFGDRAGFEAIFTRRMDRGKYDPHSPVDDGVLETVKGLGDNLGVEAHLFKGRTKREAIALLQSMADGFVASNKKFARELGHSVILNDSELGRGMPGDTFLQDDEETARICQVLLTGSPQVSDIAAFAQSGARGIRSAFVVGMLTVAKDDPIHWVKAGVVLEKTALLFESRGIRSTIHAGLAEVDQVSKTMLRSIGWTRERPVILFRAGYPDAGEELKPHTPRVPLSEVLLS